MALTVDCKSTRSRFDSCHSDHVIVARDLRYMYLICGGSDQARAMAGSPRECVYKSFTRKSRVRSLYAFRSML